MIMSKVGFTSYIYIYIHERIKIKTIFISRIFYKIFIELDEHNLSNTTLQIFRQNIFEYTLMNIPIAVIVC